MRYIIRELLAEKTRVILTVFAIAWGTFAITSMLAIGEGLRLTFAKAVKGVGENLLTVNAGVTSKTYQGIPAATVINLTVQDLIAIKHLPNIAQLSSQYSFTAKLAYQHQNTFTQIQAVSPIFAVMRKIELEPQSRFISNFDMQSRSNVMVLGNNAAITLFPHANPVGKSVLIGTRPFLVIGVARKKSELVAIDIPDAYLNWIPSSTYELLANPKAIDSVIITYADKKFLPQLKNDIRKIIALHHGADPADVAIVNFDDIAKQQSSVEGFFIGMQVFLGIVGGLTLLVAGVGISNVMYAAVTRATRDIGVRKALGATTYRILFYYISESLFATFIGGVIGIILSVFFISLMKFLPLHGDIIDAIGKPLPVLSGLVMLTVILALGIFGLLAGIFPALKATRIDPAEALIYE